jgi:hypothetical protein
VTIDTKEDEILPCKTIIAIDIATGISKQGQIILLMFTFEGGNDTL